MEKETAQEYACPMHCKGDKVYPNPGECPVCNMHLVEVEKSDKEDSAIKKNVKVEDVHQHHQHTSASQTENAPRRKFN